MGKPRHRLRWDTVERVVRVLISVAGEALRWVDTLRGIR
jgi:hypothetical protein